MIYNKLVRDKIPEIIEKQGKKANLQHLEGYALKVALKNKLIEEANEVFYASTDEQLTEELADVIEVLFALMDRYDVNMYGLSQILRKKRASKGGFDKGCYLESVED